MKKIAIFALAATSILASAPVMARDHGASRPDFSQLDANGDGQITQAEVKAFGATQFAEADTDGDGSLTLEELTARAKADRAKKMGKRAKRMLKRLDSDGNGTIELAEMEEKQGGMRMFDRMDENEDGVISQEEFDAKKGKRHRKEKRKSHDE
ncbi:EF-hand domain-containing protein [Planktomarina sp.]|uniref:EF-hand domain-containing protein n=1 Tax=Planktomarina sp. TaxID=2024851 RepID=UPI003C3B4A4A